MLLLCEMEGISLGQGYTTQMISVFLWNIYRARERARERFFMSKDCV